ncbi:hypothetical protein PoB_000160700 [Plakobranchus ocellatus]|uniref:Uncharacterized protein n=1 Tax=Plakobranchus ocellatus TaxID=259542 RepID=A0AAV3XYA6_9GAST|nr:hypothetical protein PoB_000160700 [Plakobranchus ocellatus]
MRGVGRWRRAERAEKERRCEMRGGGEMEEAERRETEGRCEMKGDFLSKHVNIIDLFTIAVWGPAKNSPTGLSRVVRGDQGWLSPMNL